MGQSPLEELKLKAKYSDKSIDALKDALLAVKYMALHQGIIENNILTDESKAISNDYFIPSENLEPSTIDDLMVFCSRWAGFIRSMFNKLASDKFLSTEDFYYIDEIEEVFSNLHNGEYAGIKYTAFPVVVGQLNNMTKIISIIAQNLKEVIPVSDEEFENMMASVRDEEVREVKETDINLEELGVSFGWGQGGDSKKEDESMETENRNNAQSEGQFNLVKSGDAKEVKQAEEKEKNEEVKDDKLGGAEKD